MNTLIILSLAAAVILAAVGRLGPPQAQPPQIIYVQTAPADTADGTGCLPLLILVGVIVLAIALG